MKAPSILAFLLLTCVVRAAEPAELPELARASVTIPYSELRALWAATWSAQTAAAQAEPALPVSHVVHRAEMHLQLGEKVSTLDAAFDVEVLDAKWQDILLLGGDARLDSAEAGDAPIVWRDGYNLLTHTAGRHAAALHLSVGGLDALTASGLVLQLGPAAVKQLRVSGIPAGLEARVDGLAAAGIRDGAALFHLPSGAGKVTLQLAAPRIEKPPQPSTWTAQAQVLVRYADGRLRYETRVFAHTDAGAGTEIFLVVPVNAVALSVAGDDLADWAATRVESGRRMLRVRWKTADVLDRELSIAYAIPQSPLAEQWQLQAPASPEQEESRNLYAIVPAEGLELKGAVAPIAAHRLPQWMREAIGGAAFVTAEAGPQVALQTHWLPAVATAEAVVTEAKCQLRLVVDGSMQTSVAYTVRHEAPLAWRLELPADAEILSCTVAGRLARPVQRDGGIELSLPAPDATGKGATPVALTYAAKTQPLDPVSGQAALELPRTPLFVERLDWQITLPDAFEVTAIDGNLSVARAPAEAARHEATIHLRKELSRAERPSVALFYQRRAPAE